MMYRSMTESIHTEENDKINSGEKKIGFVVDLNISRVLNTCLDYNVYKKDLNTEQKISYLIENNLINIDADLFQGRENKTKLVEKLLQIWKYDPINHLKILLKKIEDYIIDMETTDQKHLNKFFINSIKDGGKVDVSVKFDEENQDALQSGKEVITNGGGEPAPDKDEENDEEEKETNISLTKDVLPFIIPLICILTLDTDHKDILEMLNVIKQNPTLLEVFQDQSFIWWNNRDIIRFIETIIAKYIKRNTSIYNIAIQFKMSLKSLIDNPKELLELIDSCLKPKQKEKDLFGEVFTPMFLINEKLDNLDIYYITENGHSIFTEAGFRWFDPAAGMGNYPVAVYLRLMEGLKQQIPCMIERKKHIIENMLFMSELNKKNVFICHQIFNINNEFKMNLFEGDTLEELDIKKEWNIEKFDVVMGNPPYNKGGIRAAQKDQSGVKTQTIWTKFIDNSFELWLKPDGYLIFINPLTWLKKTHSLHKKMLDKRIIWLKLWDYMKSVSSINGKIPISLYILKNTINNCNKPTEIISEIQSRKFYTTTTEYINSKYSIPLAFHSIFNKLVNFIEKNDCSLEYKTKTVKSDGIKEKIPLDYSLNDMWAIDTFTIRDGIMVKKTTEKHPDANKRKLIIANKSSFNGVFIDEGNLSLTGNHKFYIMGENLELIIKLLSFNIIEIISHCCKYAQEYLENDAFNYIPDIRKIGITDITEEDFYKLLELTEEEIKQIYNTK